MDAPQRQGARSRGAENDDATGFRRYLPTRASRVHKPTESPETALLAGAKRTRRLRSTRGVVPGCLRSSYGTDFGDAARSVEGSCTEPNSAALPFGENVKHVRRCARSLVPRYQAQARPYTAYCRRGVFWRVASNTNDITAGSRPKTLCRCHGSTLPGSRSHQS